MAKRESISKKVRYDIFKRDSFKCQYCGRSAPDVILEIDHIQPVAEGGGNDPLNLITSCRECNRGKGKQLLTENQTIQKQKAELDEMNERRKQMEMMIQWKKDLVESKNEEVRLVGDLIRNLTNYDLTGYGEGIIRKHLNNFSFDEVYTATEISFTWYYLRYQMPDDLNFTNALNKIGGICYNRRKQNGTV